ncbi:hypothetical protein DJ480_29325 [Pseudomonas sp. Leaf98]|nr:hypothetical protein DJ480_29325 [Pseudomonas sp. Leaf98]
MGAGLPAMQTPRCVRHTELMLSQASQLPHLIVTQSDTFPTLTPVVSTTFFQPEQAVTVPIIKPKPPGSDL